MTLIIGTVAGLAVGVVGKLVVLPMTTWDADGPKRIGMPDGHSCGTWRKRLTADHKLSSSIGCNWLIVDSDDGKGQTRTNHDIRGRRA